MTQALSNSTRAAVISAALSNTSQTTLRAPSTGRNLRVTMANTPSEIREAQKLRWKVFAEEMGARLQTPEWGVDSDSFDAFCKHLIVTDEDAGCIVGTYRILSPDAAWAAGSYYSEGEFDLQRLDHLRGRMVEIGRSCIDPEFRSGAVITLLWGGLAKYMLDNGYEYLIGCASISMGDGGHAAASIYEQVKDKHACPPEYRVYAHTPLPVSALNTQMQVEVPALIKGYLRAGAWVCGEPAWDPDFNTADLPMLLSMSNMSSRYARHFIGGGAA